MLSIQDNVVLILEPLGHSQGKIPPPRFVSFVISSLASRIPYQTAEKSSGRIIFWKNNFWGIPQDLTSIYKIRISLVAISPARRQIA